MNIQIETAKSGVSTMKINDFYIHSKYDPIKEAEKFITNNYKLGKTIILYGYGLGYIVESYKEARKFQEKIIVIDPFLKIEKKNEHNIFYLDGGRNTELTNDLNAILNDKDTGNTEIICSPNYRNIDEKKYAEIYEMISNILKAKIINYNTILSMAWTWYENFLDNLKYTFHDETITSLFNQYTCPVIVVAGGPSLTKQLPLLKSIKGKCVILCAGSTIRTLLKHDIEPDYIVNVDGGQKNLLHFETLQNSHINYIYGLQSTKGIRENFKGNSFYFSPISEPLSKTFIKKYMPSIRKIEGGVSVATYTLAIASYISGGPIALIGQDLAYTNNSSHADGNVQQEQRKYVEDHFYKKVLGYFDDEVFSDATLISMKDNIEQVLLGINKRKDDCYNCTEGGAKINYISQLPFAKFIEQFINDEVEINKIKETKKTPFSKYNNFLEKSMQSLNKRILALKKCIYSIEQKTQVNQMLQVELNKCKELIEELNLQGVVNLIELNMNKQFKPMIYDSKEQQLHIANKKNEYMFKELLIIFEQTEDLIKKQLEKL